MNGMVRARWGVLFLAALLLAGCSVVSHKSLLTQPLVSSRLALAPGQAAGQTLTSRDGGLKGITFFLELPQPAAGELVVQLWDSPGQTTLLAQAVLPPENIRKAKFYTFYFPEPVASRQVDFYVALANQTDQALQVGYAGADSYLDGAAYWDGRPQDAQLAFRLVYGEGYWFSLVLDMLAWLRACLVFSLLFVLPGWAVLHALWREWGTIHWPAKIPLAAAMGLALYPLWLSWSFLVSWQNGLWFSRLLPVLAVLVVVWQQRAWLVSLWQDRPALWPRARRWLAGAWHPADLAFLLLLLGLAYSRFAPLRFIDLPLFGDSVAHVMITQLLVDNNGLFSSWQPYTEIGTFSYHFGFHAAAAAFHWLSGESAADSVLWVGQILNLLAVWGLYPLTLQAMGGLKGTRPAAIPAALTAVAVAGLAAAVPQVYLNWGRDTQLIGQVLLAPLMVLCWNLFERERLDARLLTAAAILMAGLALSHYRVLLFGVLFVALAWLFNLGRKRWAGQTVQVVLLGLFSLVLSAAWLGRLFAGRIMRIFSNMALTPASEVSQNRILSNQLGDIAPYAPIWLWLLAAVALGWLLYRREKGAILVSAWAGLLLLAANPHWLSLPGLGVLSTFAVLLTCYIPLGVLPGAAFGLVLEDSFLHMPRRQPLLAGVFSFLFVALAIWMWLPASLQSIEVKTFSMVGRPDLRAFDWIRQHTPADSLMAVNAFLTFNDNVIAGADGGWWLALMTGRSTILPPMTYGFENGESPDFTQKTNTLVADIIRLGAASWEGANLLLDNEVDYVYIGQQQGRVNNQAPIFVPDALLESGRYRPVYHQDRVWIFEILPP